MNNFKFSKAGSVEEAITQVTQSKHQQFVAGGTNLIDLWKYNLVHFDGLVDVNNLLACKEISKTEEGGLMLGALVSNADTAWHPLIELRYPLLSKAILAGASPQIRNMATNGGNLLQRTRCYYFYDAATACNKREPGSGCSAIEGYNRNMAILGTSEHCIAVFPSDMCVALAALDAVVHITSSTGKRQLDFADFHRLPGDTPEIDNNLQPGEIITGIELPSKGFAEYHSYLKLRDRNSYAFALVSVATGLSFEGDSISEARIALGGLAHKPWRLKAAEDFLVGKTATRENFDGAATLLLEGAIPYQYNSFKIELARRAIVRNCLMALDPSKQIPGAQPV